MFQQITQAIRGGQYTAPRTILGFLGTLAAIGAGLAFGAIVVLANISSLRWMIGVVLLVSAIGLAMLVRTVIRLAEKDPTPLVLGEISGEDFTAHKQMLVGDSVTGERLEPVEAPSSRHSPTSQHRISASEPAELAEGEE